jgi:hypothetical protein
VIEAAAVIALDGEQVLHWHLPPNRTAGGIPHTTDLWEVYLKNRHAMAGGAHTHPGHGWPEPSWEDITTNEVIEDMLVRRYRWWVASMDRLVVVEWVGPKKYDYKITRVTEEPGWVQELRRLSQEEVTKSASDGKECVS